MTKSNFPWKFAWNFLLLILACVMTVSQFINHSMPGAVGFGMIVYILVKLTYLESR
jgi:hypothetical protein